MQATAAGDATYTGRDVSHSTGSFTSLLVNSLVICLFFHRPTQQIGCVSLKFSDSTSQPQKRHLSDLRSMLVKRDGQQAGEPAEAKACSTTMHKGTAGSVYNRSAYK